MTLPFASALALASTTMFKTLGTVFRTPMTIGLLLGLVSGCGGSGASTEGKVPKAPAAAPLAACASSEVCTELSGCLLTSKEHLEAFNCRACSDEAVKACEDPKACPIRDASSVEALVCRAIRKEVSCKDATAFALEAWRKDGEPPFLDEGILKRAISERYARQAKSSLACPVETTTAKP